MMMDHAGMRWVLCAAMVLGFAFGVWVERAWADEVRVDNGTVIIGRVVEVSEGKLVVETDLLEDAIRIPLARVTGVTTDEPVFVQTTGGERVLGRLRVNDAGGQQVVSEALGAQAVSVGSISAMWGADAPSPAEVAKQAAIEAARPKWRVRVEAGFDGQTGNTERLGGSGRVEIKRSIPDERLLFYAQGRYSEENGARSVNEIMGGAKFERDFSERLFAFAKLDLEFDEFESLDLRTIVSGGVGYFVIGGPDDEEFLKVRAGLGFKHEAFDNNTTQGQAVAELGADLQKPFAPWVLLTHNAAIYPSLEDGEDLRISLETAVEIPLDESKQYRLRMGIRNEYDGQPQPGVEEWDTYYFGRFVMDLK